MTFLLKTFYSSRDLFTNNVRFVEWLCYVSNPDYKPWSARLGSLDNYIHLFQLAISELTAGKIAYVALAVYSNKCFIEKY